MTAASDKDWTESGKPLSTEEALRAVFDWANDRGRRLGYVSEPESLVEWAERMPEFGPDTIIHTGDQSRAEIEKLL